MASSELILSESEWQRLLLIREYAKQLFDVDITRNDGFQTKEDAVYDGGFSLPPTPSPTPTTPICFDNKGKEPSFVANSNVTFVGNLLQDKLPASTNIIHGGIILRPPPVIARIETKSSPDNLEMCKKFVVALTPSNPDFRTITFQIENQHHFEMVQAHSTSIQQSTAALIQPCPKELDLTIQGHYSCVEAASSQVNMILHDLKSKALEKTEKNQTEKNLAIDCFNPAALEGNNNNAIFDERLKIHDFWSEQPSSSKITKATSNNTSIGPASDRVYNDPSHGNAYNLLPLSDALRCPNSSSNQEHCKRYENSLHDKSSDSEEDNILTDNRFKSHIDQASKCGFSDKQITHVLRKLGACCSIDEMMRELIQQPQEVADNITSVPSVQESVDSDAVTTLKSKEEEDNEDSKEFDPDDSSNLRHIVIDGSNVAMSHGLKVFSCMGIKIVVDWFKKRGHKNITVFVPQWRKEASRPDAPISNQEILSELEQERIVVFTPARRVGGTRIVCYDDRYVLQLAVERKGIVVSNDVYRDLVRERDDFREVVDKRLLMYSFVNDTFMPPEDPLGRQGPSLDNFLRIEPLQPKNKPQNCPYGKKCTYGNKCRFYHPERRYAPQKMVAEQLKENAEMKLKSAKSSESISEKGRRPKPKLARTVSLLPQDPFSSPTVLGGDIVGNFKKPPLQHSRSSSYLTGSILKMEQAESEDVFPNFNPTVSVHNQTANPKATKVGADEGCREVKKYLSNSCTASPRSSPTPSSEPVKNKLKEVKSFPTSAVPKLPPSPATVKSSLNIPSAEPQGRYLSGHLLVAKRLSDEDNNSGNFFSQHTSRTPGSPQQEMSKQSLSSDSTSSNALATETAVLHQKQNEDTQTSDPWDSSEIFLPPEIPFQTNYNPLTSQKDGAWGSTRSPYHMPTDNSSSNSESCNSCPVFSPNNEVFVMPQSFQRSLSTHTPFRPSEHQQIKNVGSGRKYSLNANLKPQTQTGIPSDYHMVHNHPKASVPFQSYQGNSSFDSGISSGGLISTDQISSTVLSPTDIYYPPLNSPRNGVLSPPPSMTPTVMQRQPGDNNMMFHRRQSVPVQVASQGGVGNSAFLKSGYNPPTVNPWQYSPLPNNGMPFSPHEIHNPGLPSMNSASSQLPFTPPPYSMHYSPQPPIQFHPSYQPSFFSTESQYYNMPAQQHITPDCANMPEMNQAPRAPPKVIDEDARIEPDDPRYSAYFYLSSLFGERYVRTFMNRNPDVTKQGDLLNLLSSHKHDMGR